MCERATQRRSASRCDCVIQPRNFPNEPKKNDDFGLQKSHKMISLNDTNHDPLSLNRRHSCSSLILSNFSILSRQYHMHLTTIYIFPSSLFLNFVLFFFFVSTPPVPHHDHYKSTHVKRQMINLCDFFLYFATHFHIM